ncbi:hypothetical protein E4V42_03870 [Clostridium estertheticum]|uniref:Uncharacterized protein n=1 Tax=Clostridium estertheticum TaxID=238834 RepID=A0A5N7IXP4_9CLOT|nr:UPF0175 family protein [Clostridium estertheticum]MPQ30571.1 hypothetical protein [Clostridium estertheticum]MPQ61247.1 hypothetical protein [Clostridium estertheticum]
MNIAGVTLVDFMDLLKNKNISWNEYTEDELGDSKNY